MPRDNFSIIIVLGTYYKIVLNNLLLEPPYIVKLLLYLVLKLISYLQWGVDYLV